MTWLDCFRERAPAFQGELRFGEPLSRHSYYRIGGPAALLAIPFEEEALEWIREGLARTGARFAVIGAGSNLLVSDAGFPGVVVKTTRLQSELRELPSGHLALSAGVAMSLLLRRAGEEGWGGLERLAGIPGTMGGVVAMNAGTHLGEIGPLIRVARLYSLATGQTREVRGPALDFEYRRARFLDSSDLVCAAELETGRDDPTRVAAAIAEVLARRKATQPLEKPSCGSVFKNPPKGKAWETIAKLGLRGHRIGGAEFSPKHCNFIVNLGDARAEDVRALIALAKARADSELGVRLEEEVRYLGLESSALNE